MEITLKIVVEEGAGGRDFAARVLNAIENDESVYIQVAGEYGHLRVTKLRDVDFT